MTTLFSTVLGGIEDNNYINDASYASWESAQHAIEAYGGNFKGKCGDSEMKHTVKALNIIIESDGRKREEAVYGWNIAMWGYNFANNESNVAFSG